MCITHRLSGAVRVYKFGLSFQKALQLLDELLFEFSQTIPLLATFGLVSNVCDALRFVFHMIRPEEKEVPLGFILNRVIFFAAMPVALVLSDALTNQV